MANPLKSPSVQLAAAFVALVLGGGATSFAVQGLQKRSQAQTHAAELTRGDPGRGKSMAGRAGCGACHEIPGVDRAKGSVGPSLDKVAARAFIAGRLANTPDAMVQWLRYPQHIEPGAGMPTMLLTEADARDIAAYLYTLN